MKIMHLGFPVTERTIDLNLAFVRGRMSGDVFLLGIRATHLILRAVARVGYRVQRYTSTTTGLSGRRNQW